MSRIDTALSRAKSEGRAALVTYLCAGDPNLAATPDQIVAIAEAGADVVELGVPFSDPTADGPTIQRAAERALRAGTTLPGVLDAVREARRRTDVPIVLFGYYNPIVVRGEAKVVADAAAAGVDGFLVVDVPPEESAALCEPLRAHGLDWIPLLAPTSTPAREAAVAAVASSFVYCISVAGVTGGEGTDVEGAARRAAGLGQRLGRPVALGFGIRTPADVALAAPHVDAVVVGSALVEALARGGADEGAALVRALRAATARSAQ